MGYDRVERSLVGRLSRHNSPRDDEHDTLWEGLLARVRSIVEEEKYQPIEAELW